MRMDMKALSQGQVESIAEHVENLLETHGIAIKDPEVCDFFAQKGASVDGETVRIPKQMLRDAIASVPESFTLHARNPEKTVKVGIGNPPLINGCSGMSYIQDADGTRRRGKVEDQIKMVKLAHTSEVMGVSNAGILYPTDGIDPSDAKYLQMINAMTYSDKPFFAQGMDGEFARIAIDLARIATGVTDDRCVAMSVVNSLSPMAWDKKMLSMIKGYATEGQPINISCSSMVGATAPVTLSATLVITTAEALAGVVYAQLINPGTPVVFGNFSGVMNMQHMCMSYAAPEFSMICAAGAQLASYYKMPFRGGGAMTDAKVTNFQCGSESAVQMMVALNCDVHYMHQSIGTLDAILACSAEKFVMDEEIVARIRRMQRDIGDVTSEDLETVLEGIEEGDFLGLESTALHFREEIFMPTFSDMCTHKQWMTEGRSNEQAASAIVAKRLNEYVEPDIGAAIKKDMRDYAIKRGANL